MRAEINERDFKSNRKKINETKCWFFEMINKIDQPLTNLVSKRREGD